MQWQLITSEYPPQVGGVADHTLVLAEGLAAAGDEVHVWCPAADGAAPERQDVRVHREMGGFSRSDLARVGRLLDGFRGPRRLLVQWVPHGYGWRSMNIGFCLWLRGRARGGDLLDIIVHEPAVAFGEGSWKQDVAGVVHRLMAAILLRGARRVWLTIPAWEPVWRPWALGRSVEFGLLPTACVLPIASDAAAGDAVRERYARPGGLLIGHVATHGPLVRDLLLPLLPAVLEEDALRSVLLVGSGGAEVRASLLERHPDLAGRVHATGLLSSEEISRHLVACDLLLQPYPDGVSGRRTSAMAALAHAIPLVTTAGRLTEPLWAASGAVALVAPGDVDAVRGVVDGLAADPRGRVDLGARGHALYEARFSLARKVALLRSPLAS